MSWFLYDQWTLLLLVWTLLLTNFQDDEFIIVQVQSMAPSRTKSCCVVNLILNSTVWITPQIKSTTGECMNQQRQISASRLWQIDTMQSSKNHMFQHTKGGGGRPAAASSSPKLLRWECMNHPSLQKQLSAVSCYGRKRLLLANRDCMLETLHVAKSDLVWPYPPKELSPSVNDLKLNQVGGPCNMKNKWPLAITWNLLIF